MIGDAFGKLFGWLGGLFGSLFEVIWDGISWVGNLLKNLFQGLFDLLIGFFLVIYGLIDGLLYLIYKIGVLAVTFFQVLFKALTILWSLVIGFGNTLSSLNYSPQSSSGNGYSSIMGNLFSSLGPLNFLDGVAYVLLFVLWFTTAISAMKIISSIRVGGN